MVLVTVVKSRHHANGLLASTRRGFSGPMKQISEKKLNRVKNPNWQEADQLALYKRSLGVEPGTTSNKSRWLVGGQRGN